LRWVHGVKAGRMRMAAIAAAARSRLIANRLIRSRAGCYRSRVCSIWEQLRWGRLVTVGGRWYPASCSAPPRGRMVHVCSGVGVLSVGDGW